MGFLGFFKKSATLDLIAPVSGKVVSIDKVPDEAFAEKIVGDGIAIIPTGSELVAPCDGNIGKIFKTNHAFSLETKEGVEIFVHFGINTLNLNGKGFTRVAEEDMSVKQGDVIIRLDLEYLKVHAESVVTPVVIANSDEVSSIEYVFGKLEDGSEYIVPSSTTLTEEVKTKISQTKPVEAGKDLVLRVKK
ncbi:PTS system, glucose-specific IIA component [Borrelia hermsii YBT]|uniref:PTS glucose transporter subunit IIA n=1 Tax=Borrelia hermsii TaxID=140 RepID=UPI0003E3C10C|nr:PTS glucose transporter subunit IIA [Borrelia hermsii]AHH12580.1 PTS system, glucose-specific IIA component [Borrelia hermsii YBT]